MHKVDLRIQIPTATAKGEAWTTAVTVISPDAAALPPRPVVLFAFPGGGYSRQYFDVQLPGRDGYSQAEYHAANGIVFVACDHIGVGESSIPEQALNHSEIAAVNAATTAGVLALLARGEVHPSLPAIADPLVVGIGQSYGGLLLTVQQAEHGSFAGVGMLGWSAICTTVTPSVPFEELPAAIATGDGLAHPYRRVFHYSDVADEIVGPDLAGYPMRFGDNVPNWGSTHMPGGPNLTPERGPLGPDVVVDEAAAILVPVLIANGEIDVCPDPRAEPAAYRSSPDITTYVLPRSAHMHNFAGTRELLWRRLEHWIAGLPR